MFEIFVYSPRVEGVHLRGGKVARGGLRWSDRPEDFRTEVLGLVKAQMVKNAVIVPVGSKGGFVLKQPPAGRPRRAAEGRRRLLQDFLRGLLDLTDNLRRRRDRAAAEGGAARRRRPVSRRRGRQGHRDLLRLSPTASPRVRLLARRRVRVRRLGRLRPQGDGHHRARRLGIGEAPFPRAGRRHRRRATSPWPASATCRATCSATACCCRATSSCVAAFDHRHIFLDPEPDPRQLRRTRAPLRSCRARPGPTTTPRLISAGGGVFAAQREVDPDHARGAAGARRSRPTR